MVLRVEPGGHGHPKRSALILDASAREVAKARSPEPALEGSTAANVGEWRRVAKGLRASVEAEVFDAHAKWHAQNPGRPMPDSKIRGAISRGQARFRRNFPDDRIASTAKARAIAVTNATRKTQRGKIPEAAIKMPLDGVADRRARAATKLARSMATDYGRQTRALLREGLSPTKLREAMRERASVLESRADLIGTQEAKAANVDATKAIHRRAGADSYVWLETSSANPDPEHLARVGRVFLWSDDIDHPGERINCLCSADPVLPEPEEG